MRLVTFEKNGTARLGLAEGLEVADLSGSDSTPASLLALLAAGDEGLAAARKAAISAPRYPLDELKLLPVLPRPGKIICLGLNYAAHAAEGGREKPDYPNFFMRCATSLLGHQIPIVRPRVSTQLDFEAELAAIIGREVPRHVAREEALTFVAGYACFNDVSVRDYQRRTPQWTIGKNFDATGPFGPAFVTADELPAGAAGLKIESRLNGEVMQSANTRDMIFPVDETIALLSECMTLEVGDVLVMGTPAGVGFARTPPLWMKEGDTIEVEIEGVGLLSNPIVNEI
ncbi:5-oxopent-3-ene-1,2,5-tricarboxylate decarboxylase [Parvibaculum lavamentivorans DS-1]|uniref:5-oxopent-3-ene-1,2,5-tricarboxylate decarboxylase n=1 Tax=Parvibaculum lavamentivorans (strain DS-1 / DSM 13023 / NCIMB 13966) TaxID=402881 RepID=A7HPF9_PARL1|nr:fumarylacetoacetate hydrolase family protein [Parvibaculum lavamentivorans]ABS61792.1 5-oxopent-3-ene-1,2,5-tricarboxylate decarboxylase [Parvibaculum lavamentivorans DS-1]